MFECPHCENKGIGVWDKFWCGSDSPAICTLCGNLSCVPVKYRLGSQSYLPFITSWAVMALIVYLALKSGLIYLLAAIPFVWLVGRFVELASLPMRPISKEESAISRKFGNGFVLVIIALIVGVVALGKL